MEMAGQLNSITGCGTGLKTDFGTPWLIAAQATLMSTSYQPESRTTSKTSLTQIAELRALAASSLRFVWGA